nr:HEAT repeat domain-containing protein [Planctomycetota bacterium]
LQDPLALAHVIRFLDPVNRSDDELVAAITAIRDSGASGLSAVLQRLIGHGSDDVRLAAHHALDRLAALNVADHKAVAGDTVDAVRANAVSSLGLMKHTEAAPILVDALRHDERAHVRRLAAIALGRLGDKANAPVLIESLTDSNRGVRRYAAEALAQLDYKPAIPYLLMALEANLAGAYIDRSVEVLSGQDFGYDSRANALDRAAAMDRGFAWYALHSKEFEAQ